MTDTELKTLLYEALNSSQGIVIATSSPEKLKQRLYIIRASLRKEGILDFDELTFRTSPLNSDSELWIVRKVDSKT